MQRPLGFFNVSSTFTLLTHPRANCLGFKLPSLFAVSKQVFLANDRRGNQWWRREMDKLGPSLSYDDDDSESVAKKKWICVLSNLMASIGPAQYVKCRLFLLELNS